MTNYPTEISVTAPVNQALDRVKRMLFQPFDLEKWFIIGFCAWLAMLGESGGGFNGNFNPNGGRHSGNAPSFRHVMDEAARFVVQNLYWIIPLAVAVLIVALTWGLLLTWLNSRGKFMFLHCVALDRAEIKRPWCEFSHQGNSLFLFRFVLWLIEMLFVLPLLAGILVVVGRMLYRDRADGGGIALAIGFGLALLVISLCFALIRKFTTDFVVPIMSLRRTTCSAAWTEFLAMLRENAGRFTLYVLFQIVLAIVIGFLVLGVVIVTCCLAGCLMALPYIGAVVLLPVLVFKRSYSIYYLAQFGPAYNVFPPATPV
jgi:hypothetical protein